VATELDPVDDLREVPVHRTTIHSGRLISVHQDTVRLADGTEARREVVEHRGAVALVALDASGRVILVRQWRHPVGRALWELPAGTRDRDETPEATAARELVEEAGARPRMLTPLLTAALTPGYSTEVMHFFLATGLEPEDGKGDDDERIEVGRFTPGEVALLLERGELDVKTVAGLALAGWSVDRRG
jgi:ADP-ribose pyrophosphatase